MIAARIRTPTTAAAIAKFDVDLSNLSASLQALAGTFTTFAIRLRCKCALYINAHEYLLTLRN